MVSSAMLRLLFESQSGKSTVSVMFMIVSLLASLVKNDLLFQNGQVASLVHGIILDDNDSSGAT